MEKKIDRAELSRKAWRNHREKLMAGARKAAETRRKRFPPKKKIWICKTCGMEVLSAERPSDRKFNSENHTCHYIPKKLDKK